MKLSFPLFPDRDCVAHDNFLLSHVKIPCSVFYLVKQVILPSLCFPVLAPACLGISTTSRCNSFKETPCQ